MSYAKKEEKLQKALDQYLKARDEYREACQEAEVHPKLNLLGVPFDNGTPSSTRDAILKAVSEEIKIDELLRRVMAGYPYHHQTVRNEISKMCKLGLLNRLEGGYYALPAKKKGKVAVE